MTNAEARFNKSLRPRKPEGSLGRTAQDGHLDSHTAPELWIKGDICSSYIWVQKALVVMGKLDGNRDYLQPGITEVRTWATTGDL